MKTIADPACGTGGFFLSAYDFISKKYQLNKEEKNFLKFSTFNGWEIVPNTSRLCVMNLFLHNVGDIDKDPPVIQADSLIGDAGKRYDFVMTNPPFGKKSSVTITHDNGTQGKETLTYNRQDFWATTSNKQLNFIQHIRTMLKIDGKAAVVVPDNVLFEGGAGETIRKKLLESCDVHTLLRLPTGIFYAQGVKANVIFFDNKPASKTAWTKELWIYDLRTNQHFTLKTRQMQYEDLQDFVKSYNPENRFKRIETEHFKKFTYEELIARDKANLDIFWLKDDSLGDLDNLPEPDVIALEIVENIETALNSFKEIVEGLNGN
jgi:type I restriction enzyme M protein